MSDEPRLCKTHGIQPLSHFVWTTQNYTCREGRAITRSRYKTGPAGKAACARYERGERAKARQLAYAWSEKGILRQYTYSSSEKGQARTMAQRISKP